jgi:adenosylhomocysteine nucleosidase
MALDRRPIAVLAAMPSELRPLIKSAGLKRHRINNLTAFAGRVSDHEITAITTGIGTERARHQTERLFKETTPRHVLVIGIAGGVSQELDIGDLVVPEIVRNDNTGEEFRPHPLGDFTPRGTLLTTDNLYVDPEEVARLRRKGVIALDMETAAMAEVCERHHTPWSVFRALSDRADAGLVDDRIASLTNPDGSPNGPAVARLLLTRPWLVPRLARVAADANKAYATSVRTATELLRTARFGDEDNTDNADTADAPEAP